MASQRGVTRREGPLCGFYHALSSDRSRLTALPAGSLDSGKRDAERRRREKVFGGGRKFQRWCCFSLLPTASGRFVSGREAGKESQRYMPKAGKKGPRSTVLFHRSPPSLLRTRKESPVHCCVVIDCAYRQFHGLRQPFFTVSARQTSCDLYVVSMHCFFSLEQRRLIGKSRFFFFFFFF